MHPNPAYRSESDARNLAFVRQRGFGALVLNAADGPLAAHVPFLLAGDSATVDFHLVRSNPILKLLDQPQSAVVIVSGPDGYISPDWYGVADQVPTWNYVAVHLRGTLERLPDTTLLDMLERQSAAYEARLAPKPPWTMDKLTPETAQRMMRMIVPCRMAITSLDGTWKLGQNKPAQARIAAAEAVGQSSVGQQVADLDALMQMPEHDGGPQ